MAAKCIFCDKELPEDAKIPVCEYHKGVAAENAKRFAAGAAAVAIGIGATAKDKVVPVLQEHAVPLAKNALNAVFKR